MKILEELDDRFPNNSMNTKLTLAYTELLNKKGKIQEIFLNFFSLFMNNSCDITCFVM